MPCPLHISPVPHGDEQLIICPQPLSTDPLQRPEHGFWVGRQHVPASGSQTPPFAHAPLTPQLTRCWQLSFVWPHSFDPHGLVIGLHPHVLPEQATPPSHVRQSTITPQLS